MKTIEDAAFRLCTHLQYINIPSTVTSFGESVFDGCRNLQCGLSVENKTYEYREMLQKKAMFPKRSLYECINQCTKLPKKTLHHNIIYIFVILSS